LWALTSPASSILTKIVPSSLERGTIADVNSSLELTMRRFSVAVLLPVVLLVAGCAARQVRIAELNNQPAQYADKSVRISGMVTNSFGIPLVPFQVYNVDDGTGEIAVLSRSGRAPATGTRVDVKGKLSEVAVLGGRSIGLHIQEDERRVRN
jgi:hypothetical protein